MERTEDIISGRKLGSFERIKDIKISGRMLESLDRTDDIKSQVGSLEVWRGKRYQYIR